MPRRSPTSTLPPTYQASASAICSGEARDHAIVMAYEAFNMSLGIPTRTFTPKQVMRWLRLMQKHKKYGHNKH